jgi:hypothetical protein
VENKQAVPERNVLRANMMVAPLDFIADIIRDNHWGYLYNCACAVYPRLVREFYEYLEVVQDEDRDHSSNLCFKATCFRLIIR